jgi:pentapeptide MXKDX repeat protein
MTHLHTLARVSAATVLALGLALPSATFAMDKMGKDDGMKKEMKAHHSMKKDVMSREDGMKKHNGMKKDGMKK